ncbi:pilus assembly protein [Ornithinimicrobium faecis]|uniref:Pilus assembly protein n=1 Tax=Ornithinimicrobium faecis TaxID=2934158 RepID=A0ABY4YXL0_9MICO|nr:TadE/TadG family type IV pilus assembly protein [Ornithinimicrobium sp. HY1793]USQ81490.1 pilus assembly protein [Ornithinimicrobium sp. HY1793]
MELLFRGQRDLGAAAVEFALVALMLVMILFGTIEFGRFWMIQSSLSQIAREGVREMAINGQEGPTSANKLMADRVLALNLEVAPAVSADAPGGKCSVGETATAVITASGVSTMTGIDFWGAIDLKGKAEMRCGG